MKCKICGKMLEDRIIFANEDYSNIKVDCKECKEKYNFIVYADNSVIHFKKYTSIPNWYNINLNKVSKSLVQAKYIASAKIHGTNFQIITNSKGHLEFAKRTDLLKEDTNFFDYQNTMNNYYSGFLKKLKSLNKEVRVYAELYGKGVQGQLSYHNETDRKHLVVYDIFLSSLRLTPHEAKEFLKDLGYKDLWIKNYGTFNNLKEALDFDVENLKPLYGEDIIEGVVFRPLHLYIDFSIKKKTETFNDKHLGAGKKHIKKPKKDVPFLLDFKVYLTKHRVVSVVAKHGGITDSKDIGKMLNLVKNDAYEDFINETKHDIKPEDKLALLKASSSYIALEIKEIIKESNGH